MATTSQQDAAFLDAVIQRNLLEDAIEWIKSNLKPEEVFGEKELLDWASNYDPEDVFSDISLSSWAERNGYIKE